LNSAISPPYQRWLKFGALVLVVAALGLPVNDLFRYALLVVATVMIVTGTASSQPVAWLGAIAAAALCVLGQIWLGAPRIEEGHNVFLVDGSGGALEGGLPSEVFRLMAAEFDARYPQQRRCDRATDGCWRNQGLPDRAYAFSADGMLDRSALSRRATGVAFADPVWARLGFINEHRYNWNSDVSDVERASRDRRSFALVHRWNLEMPWFVMYRFPVDFVGSALCWRGQVLWEGVGEHFEAITNPDVQCRTLAPDDVGRRIFGVAITQPLAMSLRPTVSIVLRQRVEPVLALIAVIAVLGLLVRGRLRRTVLPFVLVAVTLAVAFLNDASFIGGVRPFDSGDDGLVYDGFARAMLQKLFAGDVAGALAGEEPVFYFTPGMRYLRAVEHLIFGETYLGYLSLILLLPFLVFALFRRFLSLSWAMALTAIFAAIPIGALFGTSLVQYVKWAARGFADPAAYVFFLVGLLLLVDRSDAAVRRGFSAALGAGLLLALALFVRPNLAPAIGILLAGAGLAALWQRQYGRAAGLVIGFLPALGMALHNWFYGGELVLFTSTARLAMFMPPSAFVAAAVDLLHFDLSGPHLSRAIEQIGAWLAGSSELLVMAPLNAAALVILVRMTMRRGTDPWLRLIAGAIVVQQCISLLYVIHGRYYYLNELLTLLVVAVWVRDEGAVLFQRRFPDFSKRVASHAAAVALARRLGRMSSMAE